MLTFILILAIIIAVLLMLVVLIQNPKGGGLASNFSSGNQFFGAAKTSDLLEKLTWGFAVAIIAISLISSMYNTRSSLDTEVEVREDLDELLESQPSINVGSKREVGEGENQGESNESKSDGSTE